MVEWLNYYKGSRQTYSNCLFDLIYNTSSMQIIRAGSRVCLSLEGGLSIATEMQIREQYQDCRIIRYLHCNMLCVSFAYKFMLIHFIVISNYLNHPVTICVTS
jgi:hypothetical protein